MRSLAYLADVGEVREHPNADRLCLATVRGWQFIGAKDLAVGQRGVFIEVDSVLPADATWAQQFIRNGKRRVRTIKLRGQLSQGVFVRLQEFDEQLRARLEEAGDNVAALIGVTHGDLGDDEPVTGIPRPAKTTEDATLYGYGVSCSPPKTEEQRMQSSPELIRALQQKSYYIALKYDGMSATFVREKADAPMYAYSRNRNVEWGGQLASSSNSKDVAAKLAQRATMVEPWLPAGFAVQGELYGHGINGDRHRAGATPRFIVFNVWDCGTGHYMPFPANRNWAHEHRFEFVDVLEEGDYFTHDAASLLELAQGKLPSGHEREGIVVRSHDYGTDGLSFKVISNAMLLKEER